MMKRKIKKLIIIPAGCILMLIVAYSCSKEFLDKPPIGAISEEDIMTKQGVQGLLIGAYAMLDGTGFDDWMVGSNNTTVWNPWAGSVAADDAHKGGGYGSQNERAELEAKTYNATNSILDNKWRFSYAAVQRANDAIRGLGKVPAGTFSDAEATQIIAEARFLRGVNHFELAKMWWNIPFIDETITFAAQNFKVSNMPEGYAWAKIEEDLQFAIDNLPATQTDKGRAYSWAAKGFLAKVYMQQGKLAEALPVLNDLIQNGTNVSGVKYALLPRFSQLWRAEYENDAETVFAAQMSVNEGALGANGNEGETSNYPSQFGGWGHQPSFNLVNAYKTENGYPMFDNFNDVDVANDMGKKVDVPFTPHAGPLDPRIDWTVARRHIPFHDWGTYEEEYNPAAGPYRGKKWVRWKQDNGGKLGETIGNTVYNGNNFRMIRFADILLWAAEVEVEMGDLQKAEDYVNLVRNRAANPADYLKTYVDNADPSKGFTADDAATYDIQPYAGADGFVAKGQAFARNAVRFERRLEFALEGNRFFDLQRYQRIDSNPDYMADLLNKYMTEEAAKWKFYLKDDNGNPIPYQILEGATFVKGKHELYAIPRGQIDQSNDGTQFTLKQNPGHF